MDWGEHRGKMARGNLPELPNSTFGIVISRVPNNDIDDPSRSQLQLQVWNENETNWEELIDVVEKSRCPKELYSVTIMYKCTLTQEEMDEE